jgi:hypothetical protein
MSLHSLHLLHICMDNLVTKAACDVVLAPLSLTLFANHSATGDACLDDWFSICKQISSMMRVGSERMEKEVPDMQTSLTKKTTPLCYETRRVS